MHVKAALIAGALTISGSAMAQNFQIGPDGIRVDRDRQERNFRGDREMRGEISQREAVNIAGFAPAATPTRSTVRTAAETTSSCGSVSPGKCWTFGATEPTAVEFQRAAFGRLFCVAATRQSHSAEATAHNPPNPPAIFTIASSARPWRLASSN